MSFRFDDAPSRIYWELTRACDLACTHCRAEANPCVDPRELTTHEIVRVLDELARECKPHVILTGGDPLKRRDFFDIAAYAVELGLPCLVAPSATPLLTREVIDALASLRIDAMSLSLDGSTPSRHDALRGVVGTFARTVQIAREIVSAGIRLQVNTLVTGATIDDLEHLYEVVQEVGAERWSLFFLVTTGRGKTLQQLSPSQAEWVLNWAADHANARRPIVSTTEAPQYRRVVLMRQQGLGRPDLVASRRGFGMRDGNGVMFISHIGNVQPSGFLPLTAGCVRTENPLQIYRGSRIFRELRQTERFTDRCGCCEFREICGGSRARAFAATGDPLGSDPLCPYIPAVMENSPGGATCEQRSS